MKRNWILKLALSLAGLALLLFGISETQVDPTLRQLMKVSIDELEQGKSIRQDQYVEVTDAYLLPSYMVQYSHSRKRGDEAHVFVPLGSEAMQQTMFDKQKAKPALWVKLERDFKTKEAAEAAMQADEPYLKPFPVSGVIRQLESDVIGEMSKDAQLQIEQPLSLHEGSRPLSFSDGAALAFAGGLMLLLLLVWTLSDLQAAKWLQALEQPGIKAFQGRSAWAIVALIAAPLFVVFGGLAFAEWMESRRFSSGLIASAFVSLAVFVPALWRSRSAALLGTDTLELVKNSQRSTVSLAEVTGLVIDERKVKGVRICKYTLHGPAKPVQVGSGLFKGGLDEAAAFGTSLRELLLTRLGPALADRLQRGERVSFGPLWLSKEGMGKGRSDGGDVLPWADVQSGSLKNGQLKIKQKGKMFGWGSFAANKIHNIDMLMHVFQIHGV